MENLEFVKIELSESEIERLDDMVEFEFDKNANRTLYDYVK